MQFFSCLTAIFALQVSSTFRSVASFTTSSSRFSFHATPTGGSRISSETSTDIERNTNYVRHTPSTIKRTTRLYLDGEGMAGKTFNKHLLGDILRALQPSYLSQMKKSINGNLRGPQTLNIESLLEFVDGDSPPPSWEDLEKQLTSQQNANEKMFRERLGQGLEHSPLATKRVFSKDPKDEEPWVTFYRDSASWCPYCQKVWIALEEKQIPYQVVKVDMNCYAGGSKPSDFLQIQPSGSLPCAVIHKKSLGTLDGDIAIAQSDDILAAIDELEASSKNVPSLLPKDTEGIDYMKFLCDDGRNSLERRLYAEWMWYLTGKRKPVEYRERFEAILDEVDTVLSNSPGPFFMGGKDISMADIKFIPFVERQAASLLYFKGFHLRNKSKWPNIVQWLEAMETRPSYRVTKSDAYTHSRSLPPQLGSGCTFYEGCAEMRDAVDAYILPSNEMPSSESMQWRESGWEGYYKDAKMAKREAAERIIFNHDKICKFAARGAGTPGLPAAAAELADPKAEYNELAQRSVDVFLRYAIGLLLAGYDIRAQNGIKRSLSIARGALGEGGETSIQATIDSLDYLRQRIGVPRDMSYPAAQEFRQVLLELSTFIMEESRLESKQSENTVIA